MRKSLSEQIGRDLYTVKEVADYLRMKPETLYNWKLRGKGPRYVQVGSRILYDFRDVADYLEKRTHQEN